MAGMATASPRSFKALWTIAPALAAFVALVSLAAGGMVDAAPGVFIAWTGIEIVVLAGAVFAAVHHADVIAHRTGEPYGTLVLTAAVTVIEVALILAVMLGSDGSPTLARDTVVAVVMLVLNGIVGICLVVGGLRYGEQGFRVPGARAYLIVLMPVATITLILPNFTTSAAGPYYSAAQLVFVSISTLLLYAVFLYVQTIRHRDYFLSSSGGETPDAGHGPDEQAVWRSVALLVLALFAVVLLAKEFANSIKGAVAASGAPVAIMGVIVAAIVLLPEAIAATRAARRNELQKAINLALGSSLATIGLTIPAVGFLSIALGTPVALGVEPREMTLILLTFAVAILTFGGGGRTNILPGFVHLVLFGTFLALIFAP